MSASPPDSGRWVTPPPIDAGSDVWSSDEYSASTASQSTLSANFSYADYAGVGGEVPRSPNVGYPATYPYYPNYVGGSVAALPPYWPQGSGVKQRVDGYAITAFICGIIGAVVFAVGFGVAALRRLARTTDRGRSLAVAGLWLSAAWVVVAAVFFYVRH
jgi:Domain of unknown function (DUF4190)